MDAWLWFAQYLEGPRLGSFAAALRASKHYRPPTPRLGVDLTALDGLKFVNVAGLENLAEALGRRLITPRGGLFYDSSYGTDIRRYLNEDDRPAVRFELETAIEHECLKDIRVLDCDAETQTISRDHIRVPVRVRVAEGTFPFIVHISDLTAEVLYGNP